MSVTIIVDKLASIDPLNVDYTSASTLEIVEFDRKKLKDRKDHSVMIAYQHVQDQIFNGLGTLMVCKMDEKGGMILGGCVQYIIHELSTTQLNALFRLGLTDNDFVHRRLAGDVRDNSLFLMTISSEEYTSNDFTFLV